MRLRKSWCEHQRLSELQRLRSIFGTSERQWVDAQDENAKQQAILTTLKAQVTSDDAHIHLDLHSLRRKHAELAGELSTLYQREEKLLSETIPDLCWELAQLQDTYILQGDYDLKVMRQEFYINRQKAIHSKKRNRLSQQQLNDLVYIKYNRALRRRYNMREKIDPISLTEIDESNEWLLGKMDDSDNDDDFVYEDEDLRWTDVAQAAGVGESAYDFRSRHTSASKGASSSTLAKKTQSSARINLADEEELNLDEETEEEDTDGYKSSDEDDETLGNEEDDDDFDI